MNNRILQIFEHSKLSRIDFANKLGISNAVLSHIASGRNKASLDLIMSILENFPTININWLLKGEGEMQIDPSFNKILLMKSEIEKTIDIAIENQLKFINELKLIKEKIEKL